MSTPISRPSRPVLPHLRRVVAEAEHGPVQSPELRQTLDALAATAYPERLVEAFWRAAGEPMDSVRRTWLAALLAKVEAAFTPVEQVAAE